MPRRVWHRVTAPSPQLRDVADRKRAALLAGLLAVIVPLGFVSGLIQLAVVPGFGHTFVMMTAALAVLAVAYGLARSRWFRVGGALATLAPLLACAMVVVFNPDDRVWYGFMCLSTVLAGALLSLRVAAGVAVLTVLTTLGLVLVVDGLQDTTRFVPPLALQGVLLPVILFSMRNQERIEYERHMAQEAVAEARRMEALGRLAGGVAHDFNNLLTVILVNAQYLKDETRADRGRVEEMLGSARRAADLVKQLLSFARRKSLDPVPLDVASVVGEMRDILARMVGEEISVQLELDQTLPLVSMPRVQLEQVLANLVVNARDAMPGGGEVTIVCRAVKSGVELVVTDTGEGMDKETAARVFEPFFTTKQPGSGSGLGLSTVFGIVDGCGGSIEVESKLGHGTTFTVFLPAAPQQDVPRPAEGDAATENASQQQGAGKDAAPPLVLVVDDEAAVRNVLGRSLEGAGFSVLMAGNGPDALRQAQEVAGELDALVTDVNMPGMDGVMLARHVRELVPGIKVLFVSGRPLEGVLDGDLLLKPFSPTVLAGRVRQLLG